MIESCISKHRGQYNKQLQEGFKALMEKMRTSRSGTESCIPIKGILKRCNPQLKTLLSGAQQHDYEFIQALMAIYDLNPTVIESTRCKKDTAGDWEIINTHTSIGDMISVDIPTYLKEIPDIVAWAQKRELENVYSLRTTIKDSEMLIFNIGRVEMTADGKYLYKVKIPVNFQEYITADNGNKYYQLQLVTNHTGGLQKWPVTKDASGGHYTSYFKHGSTWYYYNDLLNPEDRVKIVTWSEVLNGSKINSSLLFYKVT